MPARRLGHSGVGTKRILARARLGSSHILTEAEKRTNAEALSQLQYPKPWAWPIEELEPLPFPIQIPTWVARGSVQWITRARWETFDTRQFSHSASDARDTQTNTTVARPRISYAERNCPAAPPAVTVTRQARSDSSTLRKTHALPSITYAECPHKRRHKSELCAGGDEPCVFSASEPGMPARRPRASPRCTFCDQGSLILATGTAAGRGRLTRALKAFRLAEAEDVYRRAVQRLRECAPAHAARIERPAAQAKRRKPQLSVKSLAQRKRAEGIERWTTCRGFRQSAGSRAGAEDRRTYRAAVLADQRFAKNRFFPGTARRKRATGTDLEQLPDNGCDLPPASRSATSAALQRWCEEGAWAMCSTCRLLQPRPLRPQDITQVSADAEVPRSSCRRCQANYAHVVPQPADVPLPLQGLSAAIARALRPIAVDVGRETRAANGYRKKVRMITFAWEMTSVDGKIRQLPKAEGRAARAALRHLRESQDSMYGSFYARHCAFLERHDNNPTPEQVRCPLRFIEEPGLENALWPHLYWSFDMCESYERLNARRLQHLAQEADAEDPAADEDADERRHCIKRSFHCKLLSPLLGYGSDFELLQYVYDLHLWTDLGSKRNAANGTAMRLMMRGHPMSPLYWMDIKHGLHDLVRQLGYPHLYWTLAPYERSFPYTTRTCLMKCRSSCASVCDSRRWKPCILLT